MFRKLLLSLFCFTVGQSFAASVEDSLKQRIEQLNPHFKVDRIVESPLPGLFEVSSGSNVIYASKDGQFILTGDMIDIKSGSGVNLTEESRRRGRQSVMQKQPHQTVRFQPNQVKGVVTVFTDPDCFYCQKLHADMKRLNELGIEVRYLAFPRQGLGSPTHAKMVNIWCAKSTTDAMNQAMAGGQVPEASCQNTIGEQFMLGQKLGVSATPALVFSDGTMMLGYKEPDQLAAAAIQHHQSTLNGE